MKILIVEDEILVAERIKRLTENILGNIISRITVKSSLEAASFFLSSEPIDLLMLDLNLNGRDGFELLKNAVSGSYHTIIISANTNNALKAFEFGVLDFIGKPFSKERLKKALDRFEKNDSSDSPLWKYLSIKTNKGIRLIEIKDVLYLKGANIYSELHMKNGDSHFHNKSLNRFENILSREYFRIHKSYIVNMNEVKILKNYGACKYGVELRNGTILPVSRTKFKFLKEMLP